MTEKKIYLVIIFVKINEKSIHNLKIRIITFFTAIVYNKFKQEYIIFINKRQN